MLKFLVPPFIKNLDKTLVLNYPFWYIVKIHYIAYFSVLMWLISYAVGCILPIDISSYNPENVTNIWIFVFSVLGVILFCVWMYYLTIYNNEDHFGKFSIWDDVKMLAVLMIGINLLMSFSYPMQLRVKTRLGNTFTDEAAAKFFNEHFVNVSIDGELGIGPELSTKYGLNAYPFLIVTDEKGNPVLQTAGYLDPATLIAFAKEAIKRKS